jgi:hypothetical protein
MKPALRVLPAAQVQSWLPVQGVLRDVRHAFLGLCIDAGQKVLAALMKVSYPPFFVFQGSMVSIET